MTKAESLLWGALRDHRLDGRKFRRQTPIGPYFADFACLAGKLVVEADGRTHANEEAAAQGCGERRVVRTRRLSRPTLL